MGEQASKEKGAEDCSTKSGVGNGEDVGDRRGEVGSEGGEGGLGLLDDPCCICKRKWGVKASCCTRV